MDSKPVRPKWNWGYLVPLVCVAVIIIWMVETPDGLLGKADAIGYAVCHRIEARSYFLGDRPLPLCVRCSGMYIGVVVGMFYQLFRYPRRGGMLTWKSGIPFILFFLAWAFDGTNSYLHLIPGAPGLYEPQNLYRLLTGIGMGLSMAAIIVPAFNQTVWKTYDPRPVFSSLRPYAEILILGFGIGALFLTHNSLILYPLALISAAGVLLILTTVYSLIWLMFFKKENFAEKWSEMFIPLSAGLLTAIIQIAAVDMIRYWFTGAWSGFHL
jgi:uncharacterized membrane protein